MKRVLTLQDFSCFGKCSLTIAIPVISTMGVECVAIPSTILSTHTGNLGEVTIIELEKYVDNIITHIQSLNLTFDVIYIGYLGSKELISIAKRLVTTFKTKDNIVLVDPVMGDNGSLYSRFDKEYVKEIESLIHMSDYAVPNLTEAAYLADIEYVGETVTQEYLDTLLSELNSRYPACFIVTGVCTSKNEIGATVSRGDKYSGTYLINRSIAHYHGTGDMFASVLAGALANGNPLNQAIAISLSFTALAIDTTIATGTDERYGLQFESCLGDLSEWSKE